MKPAVPAGPPPPRLPPASVSPPPLLSSLPPLDLCSPPPSPARLLRWGGGDIPPSPSRPPPLPCSFLLSCLPPVLGELGSVHMCLRPAPPLPRESKAGGQQVVGSLPGSETQYNSGGFILFFGMVKKTSLVDDAFCLISGKNKTSKQTNKPGRRNMTGLAGTRTPSLAANRAERFGAETPPEEAVAQDGWLRTDGSGRMRCQLCPVGASLCWEGDLKNQADHTLITEVSPFHPSTYYTS